MPRDAPNRVPKGTKKGGQFTFGPRADCLPLSSATPQIFANSFLEPELTIDTLQVSFNKSCDTARHQKTWSLATKSQTGFQFYDSPLLGQVFMVDIPSTSSSYLLQNDHERMVFHNVEQHGGVVLDHSRGRYPFSMYEKKASIEEYFMGRSKILGSNPGAYYPHLRYPGRLPVDYLITDNPDNPDNCETLNALLTMQQNWRLTLSECADIEEVSQIKIINSETFVDMVYHSASVHLSPRLGPARSWPGKRAEIIKQGYSRYLNKLVNTTSDALFATLVDEDRASTLFPKLPPELTNLPNLKRIAKQICHDHPYRDAKAGPINGIAFKILGDMSSMPKKDAHALIKKYGGRVRNGSLNLGDPKTEQQCMIVQGHTSTEEEAMYDHLTVTESAFLEMLRISESLNR